MPPTYSQANRAMTVTTTLGPDVLLLVGFSGHEGISQLFSFELDLAAEDQSKVVFEKLLGRKVTINLQVSGGQKRYFSGICTSLTQGMRGIDHTSFQMEISPHLWLLSRRSRSRIFQNQSVPEILKAVLDIPDVTYDLEGNFHPRTYCVQYRETDFNFASRLMEEEGIYYYFKHKADGHQMVVSNKAAFPELQPAELIVQQVEGTHVREERITRWQKRQQLRSLKVTLRDHHFQMPQKSLEAAEEIQDEVKVGKVAHKLKLGESDGQEIYDWPGAYAHRFDAIDRGGADRPDELQKLLKDNERTAKIRMQQEAAESIVIQGSGRYRHLISGHTFTLKEQVVVPYEGSGSHDGKYVLTSINHSGRMSSSYRSGDAQELLYDNSFTCIPAALNYRPQRTTPKPVVPGTQTAVVVGPKSEQIHTDEFGRVKVQFHWDREGKHDAASSCWIRVTQAWADKGFGAICLPRAGQEVVVGFEEGDPDRPLILGSVYNADNPPPFKLPEGRNYSAIKTNSVGGNPAKNFSGLAFNDTPQKEHTALYSEKDMLLNAENNHVHNVGNYQHARIGHTSLTVVGSIPGLGGGSGSGGGGQGASGTTAEGDTVNQGLITSIAPPPSDWNPSPIAAPTIGLAGTTVYGSNSQDTVGLMHQITVGQATQIVLDPFGTLSFLPVFGSQFPKTGYTPGSGTPSTIGGNQQLYWGTNYQSVYGPNVTYSFAPQLNMTGPPGPVTYTLAVLIPAVCLAYEITYATTGNNEDLAKSLATAFSVTLLILNATLIASQLIDQETMKAQFLTTQTNAVSTLEAGFLTALSPMSTEAAKELENNTLASDQVTSNAQLQLIDPVHSVTFVSGDSLVSARNIHLSAWQPLLNPDGTPNKNTTSRVYINAIGQYGSGGSVIVNATDKMSLTAGGASVSLENQETTSGNITLNCGVMGNIVLRRSTLPTEESIEMPYSGPIKIWGGNQGVGISTNYITWDDPFAGPPTTSGCSITLSPTAGLKLQAGPHSIGITNSGITIDGVIIKITGKGQVSINQG